MHRAFEFMSLCINFSDNSSRSVPSVPLDEIKYFRSRCLGDEFEFFDFPKTDIFLGSQIRTSMQKY